MNKLNKIIIGLFLLTGITFLTSCIKEGGFDVPPPPNPGFSPNMTIAQFNQYYNDSILPNGGFGLIKQNIIIGGQVVANDSSGNIYKALYIEDATGGIYIGLNQSPLYNTYMVGQTVYIKCQGLYFGNYGTLPELGYNVGGVIGQIPANLISQ